MTLFLNKKTKIKMMVRNRNTGDKYAQSDIVFAIRPKVSQTIDPLLFHHTLKLIVKQK